MVATSQDVCLVVEVRSVYMTNEEHIVSSVMDVVFVSIKRLNLNAKNVNQTRQIVKSK
jgi:hypothetical protein